jgi:hypothetical protein
VLTKESIDKASTTLMLVDTVSVNPSYVAVIVYDFVVENDAGMPEMDPVVLLILNPAGNSGATVYVALTGVSLLFTQINVGVAENV